MPDLVSQRATTDTVTRLLEEGPIGMTQATKLLGTFRAGKPTHPSTVSRWAMRGFELPGGRVLKLESFRLNGRLCTSKAAILRFIQAQNDDPPAVTLPISRGTRQRDREAKVATEELDAVIGKKA